jgi:hypothetical protein
MEIVHSFDFVDFGCIFPGEDIPSLPLDQVLELVPECATIKDLFYFIHWFALNDNRFWDRCDLAW